MMSSCEAKSQALQCGENLIGLLRMFLDTHHLGLEQLAGLLRITPQTLEEWFSEDVAPPAAFPALAVLFHSRGGALGSAGGSVNQFFAKLNKNEMLLPFRQQD
jgi:hypothetical protein